eukprot:Blabericola_migrator_1__10026@NODE_5558_length_734_cov_10_745127_g3608_i0_p1_GENE_NODE_5558_length_734_cov_10_745127_g3608_i0NODE_5558_length_734_cov_10_745127_g3608_i0_p1_ORF_typecomplete_len164_score32_29CinA/PF02464_17/9_9e52_NODE_5558_length_734_cov_10_745127_g3608_i079570
MAQLNTIVADIGRALVAKGQTLTVVESCTGGWIAKCLTDISGSSQWFNRGFITYSDFAKQDMVKVNEESLIKYGAVSEEVVKEMALGGKKEARADWSIAASGIAGPGGGSELKPVGTVWFGIAKPDNTCETHLITFGGDRQSVRLQSVTFALTTLQRLLSYEV